MQVMRSPTESGGTASGGDGLPGRVDSPEGSSGGDGMGVSGRGESRARLSDQQRQIQHLIKDQLVQRGLLGRSNPQGAALFHTLQSVATMGPVPPNFGTSPPQDSPPHGSPPQGYPYPYPRQGQAQHQVAPLQPGRLRNEGLAQQELYAKQKHAIAMELQARQARTSGGGGERAEKKSLGKRGSTALAWDQTKDAGKPTPPPPKTPGDQRLGERLRRARMKEFIGELVRLVPGAQGETSRDRVLDRVIQHITQLRQDIQREEEEEGELDVGDMGDTLEVPLSRALGEDESLVDHLVGTVEVKEVPGVQLNADGEEVRQMYVRVCAKTRQGLLANVVRAVTSEWNIVSADIKTIDDSAYDIFLLETNDLETPVDVLKDALYMHMHGAALDTSIKRRRHEASRTG